MSDEIREALEGVMRDEWKDVRIDRQTITHGYISECIEEGVDDTTTLADFLKAIEP